MSAVNYFGRKFPSGCQSECPPTGCHSVFTNRLSINVSTGCHSVFTNIWLSYDLNCQTSQPGPTYSTTDMAQAGVHSTVKHRNQDRRIPRPIWLRRESILLSNIATRTDVLHDRYGSDGSPFYCQTSQPGPTYSTTDMVNSLYGWNHSSFYCQTSQPGQTKVSLRLSIRMNARLHVT